MVPRIPFISMAIATEAQCDFDTPAGDWCPERAGWKVCINGKWSYACEHHAREAGADTTRR